MEPPVAGACVAAGVVAGAIVVAAAAFVVAAGTFVVVVTGIAGAGAGAVPPWHSWMQRSTTLHGHQV